MTTDNSPVRDVTDTEFQTAVIERSRTRPVVVDFWAPWCGPCRTLGPMLERLAARAEGAWELVKVNVDDNPRSAGQYQVEGIPAVKGFRDGALVAEFTGAVPEPQVRAFLDRLLPSAADTLTTEGAELEAGGYRASAEDRYQDALRSDANHARATLALARLLIERGADDEALALLARRPADPEAAALRARLTLRRSAGGATDLPDLESRVTDAPKDAVIRYALGRALAVAGEFERALEHLLETVRLDRTLDEDGARKAMLDIFVLLGDGDERTLRYRRLLGAVLF